MRNQLDLFVNVLHCTSKKGVKTRHDDIDICVIRQNTQGKYAFDFYLNLAEYNLNSNNFILICQLTPIFFKKQSSLS